MNKYKKQGLQYSNKESTFYLWAPMQKELALVLYDQEDRKKIFPMMKERDFFRLTIPGDLEGLHYTYLVQGQEVPDPYSYASSINSEKTAILDLKKTDPKDFRSFPYVQTQAKDAIIYELHIGDISFSENSGVKYRGKYLALTEEETKYHSMKTCLDHITELGVTHVHLMPVFDFFTVDESPSRFGKEDNYNWGYDPELYNVPEGSYSTDPTNPYARIRELKELILAFHKRDIGVVMDVVYTHSYKTYDSIFSIIAPHYFYRMSNGKYCNGSGVGNELATERPMVAQFIISSLLFWQEEYQIDGFRFDLMALMDRKTIHQAIRALKEKNPYCLIYGEPWFPGATSLALEDQMLWTRQDQFALFNSSYREAMKGDNDGSSRGFIQGAIDKNKQMIEGILGSVEYDLSYQGKLQDASYSINYFNSHDNLILEDKLILSVFDLSKHLKMTKLAFSILLTSQGIPFFHAGNEIRRGKKGDRNSYKSGFLQNAIDWSLKEKNFELFSYIQSLITLRKQEEVFRLSDPLEIKKRVRVLDLENPNILSLLYQREKGENEYFLVLHHNGWNPGKFSWTKVFDGLSCYFMKIKLYWDERAFVESAYQYLDKSSNLQSWIGAISTRIYLIHKEEVNAL